MPITFIPYIKTTAPTSTAPVTIQAETSALLRYLPYNGDYSFGQSGIIYLHQEMVEAGLTAGKIDAIEFNFSGWSTNDVFRTWKNQTIKMCHTDSITVPSGIQPDYSNLNLIGNLETVNNAFTITVENTWMKFSFDSDFIWDGRSNILISWENREGDWYLGGMLNGSSSRAHSDRSHSWFSDEGYPGEGPRYIESVAGRPDIKIHGILAK
jgi:hypothetical protein